jgi:two-component system, NtrC family, sensor histidine kinase HydH
VNDEARATNGQAREHGLRARLSWITGLRLVFLTLFLGAVAFFYLGGELTRFPFSMRVVLGAIATSYALGAVYATVLRSGKRSLELAYVQIVFDQVVWTAIVYVSGGPASGATAFYGLTCLTGAILVGKPGAFLAAATGLGLYALMCLGLQAEWLATPADQAEYLTTWSAIAYPLMLNSLGLMVVAILGGYLAERLRITGGALHEAEQRATRVERLAELGRISAWLAHEVRNPLGSISGSVEMLREAPGLSDEDKRLCDIVQREVKRLNELVGDMLDLAKPMTPEPTSVDVAALAREVVELANRGESATFVRYVGPTGSALAHCDGGHIRQVLWNLVRNAVQATQATSSASIAPGVRTGEVDVIVEARDGEVDLIVMDRGPGIPDALKPTVFDAFYTSRSQGAGIGLAVVKRIIDDHAPLGARVRVADRSPRGTAFTVTLKAATSRRSSVAEATR